MDRLRTLIRDIPDFPQPGILFRDVTPLLRDPAGLHRVVDHLAQRVEPLNVDLVAGIESRGFLIGAPLALRLGVGFVPIRKAGKLPAATVRRRYALEYGTNELEMHRDAVEANQRVLIADDVLATGGTARAAAELVEELGGEVAAFAFLIEISPLRGRAALHPRHVEALLEY